jgi:hypothetical protein
MRGDEMEPNSVSFREVKNPDGTWTIVFHCTNAEIKKEFIKTITNLPLTITYYVNVKDKK